MVKVITSGFYTTIQDLGRLGYRHLGVPIAGAMDMHSAKLANTIIGNDLNDSILEITLGKCKLLFDNETVICVSGANLSIRLNDDLIHLNTAIKVKKGDLLIFDKPIFGVRAYLAIKCGFQTDIVLGSRSYFKAITNQFLVKKGANLPTIITDSTFANSFSSVKINANHFTSKMIEAYMGPEYDLLSDDQKAKLQTLQFSISKDNNRMGYRLEETIENELDSILTSSVMPGTVQLTPSGKLIILMRDCQVTGGYPRILQLTEDAINTLAQKTTNDCFIFKLIS